MLSCYLPLTFTLGCVLILRCWSLNWYEKSRTCGSSVLVRLLQFTQNHKFFLVFPVCSHHLCMVDQDVKVSRQQKGMYSCRNLLHCCVSLPVFPHLFQFPSLVLYGLAIQQIKLVVSLYFSPAHSQIMTVALSHHSKQTKCT